LRDAAALGGFSRSALSKWERSVSYPTFHCLEALASVLQVTIVISPTETYLEW
jgi:transcriptional regulator with XRE-family HTH domain